MSHLTHTHTHARTPTHTHTHTHPHTHPHTHTKALCVLIDVTLSFSNPGLDPRPAVFGVVQRLRDDMQEDPSHTDQQVRKQTLSNLNCGYCTCTCTVDTFRYCVLTSTTDVFMWVTGSQDETRWLHGHSLPETSRAMGEE